MAVDLRRGEVCAGEDCCCGGLAVVVGVDAADSEGSVVSWGELQYCGTELGRDVEERGHCWLFWGWLRV